MFIIPYIKRGLADFQILCLAIATDSIEDLVIVVNDNDS